MGNSHLPDAASTSGRHGNLGCLSPRLQSAGPGSFVGYNCSPPIGDYNALGCNDIFSRRLLEIIRRL